MSFFSDLFDYAKGVAGLQAYLGPSTDFRFYEDVGPQEIDTPYSTWRRSSVDGLYHLSGASAVVGSEIQINNWVQRNTVQREALNIAWREALDTYKGAMGSQDIKYIELKNEIDNTGSPEDGTEQGLLHTVQTYMVWHTRSVPSVP